MATTAKRNQILTTKDLEIELGIGRAEAEMLMQRDDFPSTPLGKSMVVDRALLESWIRHNAKRVEGINSGTLFDELLS